ncbi:MAG: hypothetical protein VB070_10560 [Clostridiaceae bacterium]|nr:hypothetical protein [Clostridiaceae bacterium]
MNGQDRLFQRKWGVFTHYLYGAPGGSAGEKLPDDDWNERVRRLDTERIARTLYDVGARYYFFTLMQV